jgi:hypothetical protein
MAVLTGLERFLSLGAGIGATRRSALGAGTLADPPEGSSMEFEASDDTTATWSPHAQR